MSLLLLEWKLLTRNKRLKQQFILILLFFPFIVYVQLATNSLVQENFLLKELFLFLMFLLPVSNSSLVVFGVNAAFIEKQVTTPLSIYQIIKAKYRFYCIESFLLLIIFLPSLFIGVNIFEITAAFLFAVGFMYFSLFMISLISYKPFDVKSSTFYNFQGIDAGSYIYTILVYVVAFGFMMLFYLLCNETVALIAMSFLGFVFIVTNRIWLGFIARKFEKTKHYRLERFNEK